MRPAVLVGYLRSRMTVLGAMGALVLGQRCVSPRPADNNLPSVAHFLARALPAVEPEQFPYVDPVSIQWESSTGLVGDLLIGRPVLFLAADAPGQPHDVYRARVRVSPDGRVLAVNQWRNLTQTPLGDESALAVMDQTAVFGSLAFGQLQGATLLELGGSPDLGRGGALNRLFLGWRAYQETGTTRGIGRLHLEFGQPGPVALSFDHKHLLVTAEQTGQTATIALPSGQQQGPSVVVRSVSRQHYGGENWLHTAVDVARSIVGPVPLAWLERYAFHLADRLRRSHEGAAEVTVREHTSPTVALQTQAKPAQWPPATLEPLLEPAAPGEGQWVPAGFDVPAGLQFGQGVDSEGPFAKTWLRPDPQRPYARLYLVALDMRRLSIGMEAGYEEPKPKTGPPGRGALPPDVALRSRVVATFNGAFKSIHGDYGMMVDGRLLVPPKPNAATVVVRNDGWVGLGTWPDDATDVNIPDEIVAFRQNLDPLIAGGKLNPAGRQRWGLKLAGGSVVTERSALCRTSTGQLYYAWGRDLTGDTLAAGLLHAGCNYAIHLDMNPGHAGLAFTRIEGTEPAGVAAQLAVSEMTIHPREHALWSDKDFFYVMQSDPSRSLSPRARELSWLPSPGLQPEPAEWPSIWASSRALGALNVHVLRVDPGRVRYALTASTLEPLLEGRPAPRRSLRESISGQAVLAVSLGHTTIRTSYGLAFGKRVTLSMRRGYGNLIISANGELDVLPSGQIYVPRSDEVVSQLPELVVDGVITPRATERGGRRVRGAVCVQSGHVWVATVDHDSSDAVAVTLRDLGCDTVLELDRGSRHPVDVRRGELDQLASEPSERTLLWAVAKPMQPRTFEF